MDVEILKTCGSCGQRYWWTAQKRQDYRAQGLPAPTQCSNCCPEAQEESWSDEEYGLVAVDPSSGVMVFPQDQQPVITPDIQQLLAEASAPIVDRRRTVSEWLNCENVREKQLASKLWAGQAANSLVQQRLEFIDSVSEIARRADAFRRERLEAQLTAVELEDRIAERLTLRNVRLATQHALEEQKRRNLLVVDVPPVPERVRMIRDHRESLRAKATVRRETLSDLESAVQDIFNSQISDEQKGAQIRAVLEVYQQDENTLTPRIRAFLTYIEGDYGN